MTVIVEHNAVGAPVQYYGWSRTFQSPGRDGVTPDAFAASMMGLANIGGGTLIAVDTQLNVFRSTNHGVSWSKLTVVDNDPTVSQSGQIDILYRTNSGALLTSGNYYNGYASTNHLYRSTNSGGTWSIVYTQEHTDISPEPTFNNSVSGFVRAANGDYISYGRFRNVAGAFTEQTLRSTNDGLTWVRDVLVDGNTDDSLISMVVLDNGRLLTDPNVIDSTIYKSTNDGSTWSTITVPWTSIVQKFLDLGSGIVLAAVYLPNSISQGEVWRSTDYGETWTKIRGGDFVYTMITPAAGVVVLGAAFPVGGFQNLPGSQSTWIISNDYGLTYEVSSVFFDTPGDQYGDPLYWRGPVVRASDDGSLNAVGVGGRGNDIWRGTIRVDDQILISTLGNVSGNGGLNSIAVFGADSSRVRGYDNFYWDALRNNFTASIDIPTLTGVGLPEGSAIIASDSVTLNVGGFPMYEVAVLASSGVTLDSTGGVVTIAGAFAANQVTISNGSDYCAAIGGNQFVFDDAIYSAVLGGNDLSLTNCSYIALVGGSGNQAVSANYGCIAGGNANSFLATNGGSYYVFIGGGSQCTIDSANYAAIVGGSGGVIVSSTGTSSDYATMVGGSGQTITDSLTAVSIGGATITGADNSIGIGPVTITDASKIGIGWSTPIELEITSGQVTVNGFLEVLAGTAITAIFAGGMEIIGGNSTYGATSEISGEQGWTPFQSPHFLFHTDRTGGANVANGDYLGSIAWESNVTGLGTFQGTYIAAQVRGIVDSTHLPVDLVFGTSHTYNGEQFTFLAKERLRITADGLICIADLPLSDPNVPGALWNNGGAVYISATHGRYLSEVLSLSTAVSHS